MKRQDLWEALAQAKENMSEAIGEWMADQTPTNCAKAQAAIRHYADRLTPVIGAKAAFKYQATYEAFEAAIDRQQRHTAAMAGQPAMDEADLHMMEQLKQEQTAALEAHKRIEREIESQLAEALVADTPDED